MLQCNYDRSLEGFNTALSYCPDEGYVPCTSLDNVLTFKGSDIKVRHYSILDGSEVDSTNIYGLCEKVKELISRKEYPTTDHLFTSVEVGGVIFLYVSLDNSLQANRNGHALYKRLERLCEIVSACISNFDKDCVVFFSESCRPSFDYMESVRMNEVSWFKMRQQISYYCKLEYLGECSNKEDSDYMSYGVSAFCTCGCIKYIDNVLPRRILTEGVGSGSMGIKLVSGQIIWGIYLPFDISAFGPDNMAARAMVDLVKIFETYEGSVLAMGDFNTIPGKIMQSIVSAVPENMEFLCWNMPTFLGAHFDRVQPKGDDMWQLI